VFGGQDTRKLHYSQPKDSGGSPETDQNVFWERGKKNNSLSKGSRSQNKEKKVISKKV